MSGVAVLIVGWQLVSSTNQTFHGLMPTVPDVFGAFLDLVTTPSVRSDMLVTMERIAVAFMVGEIIGSIAGFAMATSSIAAQSAGPLVRLTYSLPKTAIYPLVLLWLGIGDSSIVAVAALGAGVPAAIHARDGARAVDPTLKMAGRALGASRLDIARTVVLPGSLPYVLTGMRMSYASATIITLSAEMIAASNGIGTLVTLYGNAGAFADMFGAILLIAIVAYAFDRVLSGIRRRQLRWMAAGEQ